MEDEQHGTQEAQDQRQEDQPQNQQQAAQEALDASNAEASAYEAQIAERDARIAELEGQIVDAAKNAETAKELRGELKQMRRQAESDRIEFGLKLAGCRNVKAAKAVLVDYDGDIDAMRDAESWLFAKHLSAGATGLPNAGAAEASDKELEHWREVAGLADDEG